MSEDRSTIPASSETEASVLGACLSEGQAWWKVLHTASGGDSLSLFHTTDYRLVARVLDKLMANDGEIFHQSMVIDELSILGAGDVIDNLRSFYVGLISSSSITQAKDLRSSINELVAKRTLREQLGSVEKIRDDILTSRDISPTEISRSLKSASVSRTEEEHLKSMSDIIDKVENPETAPWHLPTGITKLDEYINGGLAPGRNYVIGARSKVGKTTLLNNIVLNILEQPDTTVIFLSLESQDAELYYNLVAAHSLVDKRTVEDWIKKKTPENVIDPEDLEAMQESRLFLKKSSLVPMFFTDIPDGIYTLEKVIMNIRIEKGDTHRIVLVYDYLQILAEHSQNQVSVLNEITRMSKIISMDHNVPLIYLSQINRGVEDGTMPSSQNLKGTGSIEQDADVVILLNRPSMFNDDEPAHIIDVSIALNRVGPHGRFQCHWDGATGSITNLDAEDEPDVKVVRPPSDSNQPTSSRGGRSRLQRRSDDDDEV